jgi:hypothetical protein
MDQGEIMDGEPLSDRRFTINGCAWRVRLINNDVPTTAPVNGDPDVVPSAYGITISVAALDEDDNVAVDSDGRFLIFDPHTLTLQAEAIQREDFDPEAAIMAVIEGQIAVAEKQVGGRLALDDLLSSFRVGGASNEWPAGPP